MTSALERLGDLAPEPPDAKEFAGLRKAGLARLKDAGNADLSLESRFDLAYGAAHAMSLAVLRHRGYGAKNRYIVFQVLPHTLGLGPDVWRVLAKGHEIRNRGEYEGDLEVDARIVADLIDACRKVAAGPDKLAPLR